MNQLWTRVGVLNSFLRLSNTPTLVLWGRALIFQAFSFLMHSSVIHIVKMKDASLVVEKQKTLSFEPFVQISLSALSFAHGAIRTHPVSCSWACCGALSVIKFYIGINTFHELTLGVILGPMDLPRFMEAKKGSATALSWRQPGFEKDWTTLFTRSSFRNVLDVFCGFWSLWNISCWGSFRFWYSWRKLEETRSVLFLGDTLLATTFRENRSRITPTQKSYQFPK